MLERLEIIRKKEGLNKAQFEKIIEKSSGYIGTLAKTDSIPGTDVIVKISKNFPNYNLNWLLTGEGEMLKKNYSPEEEEHDIADSKDDKIAQVLDLKTVRNEIRGDLKVLLEGMTENFRVLHKGVMQGLQDNQKILRFIDDLDQVKFIEAAQELDHFLKARK